MLEDLNVLLILSLSHMIDLNDMVQMFHTNALIETHSHYQLDYSIKFQICSVIGVFQLLGLDLLWKNEHNEHTYGFIWDVSQLRFRFQ